MPNIDVITFVLDGQLISVSGSQTNSTVLNYLREHIDRRGTKEGCAEGDCGACTVVLVDLLNDELRYRSINSCIQFMPSLDGKILYTVESLRNEQGQMHPTQKAMVDCHGSQCGFCTPGFVMSLFALFKSHANPSRKEISDAISGNLCRCTGYRPIVDAGEKMYQYEPESVSRIDGADLQFGTDGLNIIEEDIKKTLLVMQQEKSAKSFNADGKSFYSPTTIDEVSELLETHSDAVILAGGTDIGLWVTKKHIDLKKVVYLGGVSELDYVNITDQYIEIGAVTSLEHAFTALIKYFPDLYDLYKRFASLPIRNAGTLVGNLANGSPIGDVAPALVVLGASVLLCKGGVRREVGLESFYLDYMKKDLQAGEFVESVKILRQDNPVNLRVYKISKRFEQDISAICAAFSAKIEKNKVIDICICYGGMAATTKRAYNCETYLLGKDWSSDSIEQAMKKLEEDFSPLTDVRASAEYRTTVAGNLLKKFYLETSGDKPNIDVRA